jgi:predicted ATPase
LALWFLGYPDQAQQRSHEVLILAQELSHPFSLTYALDLAARLLSDRREGQAAQERAEAVIALSIEQGFQFYVAAGTIRRGWALAEQGQVEEGIAQMQQGLAAFRATRSEVRPYLLALLAEAYRQGGQAEEGLAVLAEALALMDKSGERNYEAEMYRLKGELTLQKLSVTSCQLLVTNPQHLTPSTQAEVEQEAEECFLKAIEIARRQQAKSLELRATTSLARLWQQQGKHHAARNTLFAVYNWFTEGFDTKDLQEAKKLLEELA